MPKADIHLKGGEQEDQAGRFPKAKDLAEQSTKGNVNCFGEDEKWMKKPFGFLFGRTPRWGI